MLNNKYLIINILFNASALRIIPGKMPRMDIPNSRFPDAGNRLHASKAAGSPLTFAPNHAASSLLIKINQ